MLTIHFISAVVAQIDAEVLLALIKFVITFDVGGVLCNRTRNTGDVDTRPARPCVCDPLIP